MTFVYELIEKIGKNQGVMEEKFIKKVFRITILVYFASIGLIYLVANKQFHYQDTATSMVSQTQVLEDFIEGDVIRQNFTIDSEYFKGVTLIPATYGEKIKGKLEAKISDETGTVIADETVDMSEFEDNQNYFIELPEKIVANSGEYTLELICKKLNKDSRLSFYYGNSIKMSRGELERTYDDNNRVFVNDEGLEGELCLSVKGMNTIWFGEFYWIIMGLIGILLIIYLFASLERWKAGKKTLIIGFLDSVSNYKFLISQLVKRDFKTKYKRSVLGVCWSFLNPLLMMLVQYIVFSTIFSSGVANYPVYLLSGIVMFNFFSECCAMGITAITSNSSLITKVYVPKYIYPLSRAISSLVNLGFSLIPLFIVTIVTGLWPRPAFVLLPFPIICMMIFSLGMSYFLSTSMVFFKDTQFIWNVLSTVWLYSTPIFYTENIINNSFLLKLFHCNPMYQFIYFVRSILIDGISPSPEHYLYCIILSVIPFMVGFWFFKKNEDKFIFNL